MKLQQQDLQRILTNRPADLRGILVYGPDAGHVSETAEALARSVVEDPSDPFRSVILSGDTLRKDPAALIDAATAMSLTGGSRLVWVRGATDALAPRFQDLADIPEVEALVVVQGDALDTRSKLRRVFESAPNLGAVACYGDDGAGLVKFIKQTLEDLDVQVAHDALDQLAENLGGDRRQTRSELEKLSLMVGAGGKVTLDAVIASVGDSASLAVDDIAYAAADGNGSALDLALSRASADGENSVRVLRTVISHFQRLHQAMTLIEAGASPDSALDSLRPPVFRNRQAKFKAQLGSWSTTRLEQCLDRLFEAEFRCKSSGMPDDVVCAQTLIGVSLSKRRSRRSA